MKKYPKAPEGSLIGDRYGDNIVATNREGILILIPYPDQPRF